jgi:hypothetical protein
MNAHTCLPFVVFDLSRATDEISLVEFTFQSESAECCWTFLCARPQKSSVATALLLKAFSELMKTIAAVRVLLTSESILIRTYQSISGLSIA